MNSMYRKYLLITSLFMILVLAFESHAEASGFVAQVTGTGRIRLKGWARLRGELMIYVNYKSMERKDKYPYCISAVFRNQEGLVLSSYNAREVIFQGTLIEFAKLGYESGTGADLLPRKILGGSVIPNFCYGKNVVLLDKVQLASKN